MKQMLVVVDMQNDFIGGTLGSGQAEAIVPRVTEKIRAAREAGWTVAFTLDTHDDGYLQTQEGEKLPVAHCVKGTEGHRLHSKIAAQARENDLYFEKPAFGSVALAEYLRQGTWDRVELVGLCTDICVISNALLIKAFCPETAVAVDAACCAGVTEKSHLTALRAMGACQVEV